MVAAAGRAAGGHGQEREGPGRAPRHAGGNGGGPRRFGAPGERRWTEGPFTYGTGAAADPTE